MTSSYRIPVRFFEKTAEYRADTGKSIGQLVSEILDAFEVPIVEGLTPKQFREQLNIDPQTYGALVSASKVCKYIPLGDGRWILRGERWYKVL